jgi:hypothetical protein
MAPREPEPSRLMLGLAALLFVPVCAGGLWGMLFNVPAAQNLGESLGKLIIEEILALALAFFLCGFLWALFMPLWVHRLLDQLAKKIIWLLAAVLAPGFCMIFWNLWIK